MGQSNHCTACIGQLSLSDASIATQTNRTFPSIHTRNGTLITCIQWYLAKVEYFRGKTTFRNPWKSRGWLIREDKIRKIDCRCIPDQWRKLKWNTSHSHGHCTTKEHQKITWVATNLVWGSLHYLFIFCSRIAMEWNGYRPFKICSPNQGLLLWV